MGSTRSAESDVDEHRVANLVGEHLRALAEGKISVTPADIDNANTQALEQVLSQIHVLQEAANRTLKREHLEREIQAEPGDYGPELLRNLLDAVVVANRDGTIHSINPAAKSLFEYEGPDVVGQPLTILAQVGDETPEQTGSRGQLLQELFTSGSLQGVHVSARSNSGTKIPLQLNATLMRSETDELLGILLVARDSRDTKEMIEESLRALEDLEADAAKTMQLEKAYAALDDSHQQLRNMQGQLIQAGRLAAVGELGAGIAHELNQPLTTIQGFAQRMLAHPTRQIEECREDLELIVRGSERMAKIVNNIRRFARQDTFAPRPIDLMTPCRDALALMGEQLRLRGIQVVIPETEFLPLVAGDLVQLEQVFLNLLGNARDALLSCDNENPNRIEIKPDIDAKFAIVRVIDNGPGLKPGDQSKIFDPFFTTKPQGDGTGLGLSIAHGILQTHGGRVVYSPAEGGGCEFSVCVPVASLDLEASSKENP